MKGFTRVRFLLSVLTAFAACWIASGQTYTISTFAGGYLSANVAGPAASLYNPVSVAVEKAGNVYFADYIEHVVLRLDALTNLVTVAAGNGTAGFSGDGGPAVSAQLSDPWGIALDSAGNLYIADRYNNRIRKVTNGVITTIAGNGNYGFSGDNGPATAAALFFPLAVTVDAPGNIYIADTGNGRIRKVTNGTITTIAGNGMTGFSGDGGPATSAQLNQPEGVAVDPAGNVYIADQYNNRIRKVANGTITTFAGNGVGGFGGDSGPATSAELFLPNSLAVDSAANLYISDGYNSRVRKVSGGTITTVAGVGCCGFSGDGGPAIGGQLSEPFGIALDAASNLYIADGVYNRRIRKVSSGVIATIAGNSAVGDGGPATSAQSYDPPAVAVDSAGNVFIADYYAGHRVRKVSNGVIKTVTGNGTAGFSGDGGPAVGAMINSPDGLAVDAAGNLYIADQGNNRIRKVTNGVVVTLAGNGSQGFSGDNGPAINAGLNQPVGLAVDARGNLYIADNQISRIRKVANGVITTVAGNGVAGFGGDGGPAVSAQLNQPFGVATDSAGSVYIADFFNHRIRKVANGVITTVAGNGNCGSSGDGGPATSAQLCYPQGIAVDSAGTLYIGDSYNHRIRKVSNGTITTLAGNGVGGFGGDGGPATSAELNQPQGLAVDSVGNIYIADSNNNRIRLLTPPGALPAIAPGGVVPIFSSVPVIQPGSWVSIYGSNLATGNFVWNGNFPISLGGVTVTIDNKPAYLWFVSPFQINLQVPDDTTTGMVSVIVTTPSGTAASTVTLAPYGPSFSLLGDGKHVAGQIATPNGTGAYGGTYDIVGPVGAFSFNTRPVKAGETLVLYGVGFGPTTPQVPAGKAFSGAALTNTAVTVTIGGVTANVGFSGITEAGLYQFNLTVPSNTGSGDQPLKAVINGVKTPTGPVVTVQ